MQIYSNALSSIADIHYFPIVTCICKMLSLAQAIFTQQEISTYQQGCVMKRLVGNVQQQRGTQHRDENTTTCIRQLVINF